MKPEIEIFLEQYNFELTSRFYINDNRKNIFKIKRNGRIYIFKPMKILSWVKTKLTVKDILEKNIKISLVPLEFEFNYKAYCGGSLTPSKEEVLELLAKNGIMLEKIESK